MHWSGHLRSECRLPLNWDPNRDSSWRLQTADKLLAGSRRVEDECCVCFFVSLELVRKMRNNFYTITYALVMLERPFLPQTDLGTRSGDAMN